MGWTRIFPNDFFTIMKSPTSIRPFLWHTAFEFWSRHFTVVTILGSQREDICTAAMHGYWQVVMTSFEQELLGNHGFSLIPLDGLSVVISANPQLLVPTKSVWHMLRSKVSLLSLNGLRRKEGGSGMRVIIPQVGRRG